jgi:hypothetical protein
LEENSKRKRRKRNQRYVIYTGYRYTTYILDKMSNFRAIVMGSERARGGHMQAGW